MTKYIAIDGMGGSGKTYLSKLLAKKLSASLYHLDDYGNDYKPFIGIPELLELVSKDESEIVIYEGVGVFNKRFDIFKPYKILVKVPEDIKVKRALSRDVPSSERSEEDWKEIWDIWNKAESEYFTDEVISNADITVGLEDGEFDVDEILKSVSR